MVAEAYISFKMGLLNKAAWDEIYYVLSDLYPKLTLDKMCISDIIALMQNDKKNTSTGINFTLLSDIGQFKINQTADEALITESLELILN